MSNFTTSSTKWQKHAIVHIHLFLWRYNEMACPGMFQNDKRTTDHHPNKIPRSPSVDHAHAACIRDRKIKAFPLKRTCMQIRGKEAWSDHPVMDPSTTKICQFGGFWRLRRAAREPLDLFLSVSASQVTKSPDNLADGRGKPPHFLEVRCRGWWLKQSTGLCLG